MVDLVKCPLRTGEEQLYRIRIYKEAYDVLHAYMLGRSGKNALYMAKYIDFFQTQFTQKVHITQSANHLPTKLFAFKLRFTVLRYALLKTKMCN